MCSGEPRSFLICDHEGKLNGRTPSCRTLCPLNEDRDAVWICLERECPCARGGWARSWFEQQGL